MKVKNKSNKQNSQREKPVSLPTSVQLQSFLVFSLILQYF